MQIYRIETTIPSHKTLTIKELPFRTGDTVEVIVRHGERKRRRGKPIRYADPFKSVAEDVWNALK